MKKTVVIGASDNSERYAYKAVERLAAHAHTVIPVGLRKGTINGLEIQTARPVPDGVDTVSLYVGPQNQPAWESYILNLKPKHIIFNPGTENPDFEATARQAGIEVTEACTLVLLSLNAY